MKSPFEGPRQTSGLGSSLRRAMPNYVDFHIRRQGSGFERGSNSKNLRSRRSDIGGSREVWASIAQNRALHHSATAQQ